MPQCIVPDESGPCFDLLCGEDAGALLVDDADDADADGLAEYPTAAWLFPDDSDDSIAEFLEGQSAHSPGPDYPARFRSKSLDPSARRESVAWILKVHEFFRFQPLTAYLAVNYFDRFLSAHQLSETKGWALQLLAVACLSLAAKMEETLVPSLLDLQVEGARFVFEPRTICKMELLVLTALNWRLRSVTPFTFIDFFAYKADPSGALAGCLAARAARTVLATIHGIEFLNHCPSSMAAAAVICAAAEAPGLQVLADPASALAWCVGLTGEGVTSCCRLMKEAVLDITTELKADVSSSSSSSSPPQNKRRRMSNGG